MATLEELLSAQVLSKQAAQEISQQNPYQTLSGADEFATKIALQGYGANPTRSNARDALIVSAIGGLLGGVGEGLGTNYTQDLANKYLQSKAGLSAGGTGQVEGLPSGLFSLGQREVEQARLKRAMDLRARGEKLADRRLGKQADIIGERQGFNILAQQSGELYPTDPRAELKREDRIRQEDLRRNLSDKQYSRMTTLRKELDTKTGDFIQVAKYADHIHQALEDLTGVSDLELVRLSILLLEPGMAVREGEQDAVRKTNKLGGYQGALNKFFTGGTELGPDVRKGLARLAKRAYTSNKSRFDTAVKRYRGIAERNKLPWDDIKPLIPSNANIEELLSKTPGPRTADVVSKEIYDTKPTDVPAGYKVQQSARTGQYRIIPQ